MMIVTSPFRDVAAMRRYLVMKGRKVPGNVESAWRTYAAVVTNGRYHPEVEYKSFMKSMFYFESMGFAHI